MLRPRDGAFPLGTRVAAGSSVSLPLLSAEADLGRERPRRLLDLQLLDHVRIEAWERLLFIECGDGWLVEEAWRRMVRGRACGLSASPQLVELAARLRGVPDCVEFHTWDGVRFPLPDRSFDRVISCTSWSAYRQPAAVLQEVARVLQPGGAAYLLESDRAPTTLDLLRLLADAGLVEVRRSHCDGAPSGEQYDATPVTILELACHVGASPGGGVSRDPEAPR
jgi:SAM-dependent methyltransferase